MKFWALVIMSDMTLKRWWMSESEAVSLLKERKGSKIYSAYTQMEAVVVGDELLWKSVEEETAWLKS